MAESVSARERGVNPVNAVSGGSQIDRIELPKRVGRVKDYSINGHKVSVSWSRTPSRFGSTSATVNVKVDGGREQKYKFGWDYSGGYGENAKHISSDTALSKAKDYIRKKTE